jgi:molecular chaperone GrpE
LPAGKDQTEQDQQPETTLEQTGEEQQGGAAEGDLQGLQQQLEEQARAYEELNQRYLRLAADFDNHRRRTRNEMEEVRRTAAKRLLEAVLPVVDNFERAIESAGSNLPENVLSGVQMIYRQLTGILSQEGVAPLETVGKPFDPAFQDAFEQVETDECPDGSVICELQKGYLLGGKLLRPALVKVAHNPAGDRQDQVTDKEDDPDE